MKKLLIHLIAAACIACSASGALAQNPKMMTTDDMSNPFARQQAPLRLPHGNDGGGSEAPVVTITGPMAGATIAIDTPISFTATFKDNWGDTHVAQWSFDTTSVAGVVSESSDSGSVSLTRTFSAPGVYAVSLTVTDQWGNSTTANTVDGLTAVVVVFDQDAGFGNGKGRIISPAGAFPADPQYSGRGDFTFGARYHKLETIPRGTTEFKLSGVNFDFLSTSYNWVVARPAGCLFSGSGTVNGAGDYAFILYGVDGTDFGGLDRFRIKITNKATGAVVYDCQMGAPDNAVATTPLDSGDINVRLPNGGLGHLSASRPLMEPAATAPARGFDLAQNFPNPFRASTEVRFSLPQRSQVKLAVFDVAGREIASLADGAWDAGSHSVSWAGRTDSGSAARGGVYFVRMAVGAAGGQGSYVAVKKMILQD